ncbi:hypothetical protein F383_35901 [Gossypium arboreum]|uniref:Uncharacterized protein n=1 Tax=Gossypium arboreum TaxID=29729 RepID=A0A0B0N7B1_GOSAR|nr:hypothetical protein F383_33332 [Gossypium arboreum]KHG08615.1 hypothetical protein F383_35901 [Gossypium arboreum]
MIYVTSKLIELWSEFMMYVTHVLAFQSKEKFNGNLDEYIKNEKVYLASSGWRSSEIL